MRKTKAKRITASLIFAWLANLQILIWKHRIQTGKKFFGESFCLFEIFALKLIKKQKQDFFDGSNQKQENAKLFKRTILNFFGGKHIFFASLMALNFK